MTIQNVEVSSVLSLGTKTFAGAVGALIETSWMPLITDARSVSVDRRTIAERGDLYELVGAAREYVTVKWKTSPPSSLYVPLSRPNSPITLRLPGKKLELSALMKFVEDAPVEIVVGCDTTDTARYGFADSYCRLGWGVFFKGEGHRRLVSRRWLEHGPWLLHRGANDTSYVQFCDLEADPDTQRAQRDVGHVQMGISREGGFVSRIRPITLPEGSYYLPEQRRFEVPVYGRKVWGSEMTDVAAIRVLQALGPERPVDVVAYVFADANEAKAHLHRMWMREIEVVTFVDGQRTVLTDDYAPVRHPPEWVERIEAGGGD